MDSKDDKDLTNEVLSLMKDSGISQTLLTGLERDPGFPRFCTEWAKQRWIERSKISDQDLICKLQNKIKTCEAKIGKWSNPLRRAVNKFIVDEEQSYNISVLLIKCLTLETIGDKSLKKLASYIDLSKDTEARYLEIFSKHKLPYFKYIILTTYTKKQKIMNKFMQHSFPCRVGSFYLDNSYIDRSKPIVEKIGKYLNGLRRVLPRVTKNFEISGFAITKRQLQTIFYLCRSVKCLRFGCCKLDLVTVPNLGRSVNDYKIQGLVFGGCGAIDTGNWNEYPEHFEHLIKGLSQTEWAYSSLGMIMLSHKDIDRLYSQQILKKYKLKCMI
ncbi:unnamed protein product [Moneuplotes crassus]|uniref:Uncharacterized protein n=1 Tax=Euplotes crassus TaxID=5936 RepID=A0AAD1XMS7_EUPCR|nr:unnamed protein product [Moneuplotes crassus]